MEGLLITLVLAGLTIAIIAWGRKKPVSRVTDILREAQVAFDAREFVESRRGYLQAISLCRAEEATDDDRDWLPTAINGLACVEFEDDRFEAAKKLSLECMEVCEKQHAIIDVSCRVMLIRIAIEAGQVDLERAWDDPTETSPEVEALLSSLSGRLETLPPAESLEAAYFLSTFTETLMNDQQRLLVGKLSEMTVPLVDRLPPNLQQAEMSVHVLNSAAWYHATFGHADEAKALIDRAIAIVNEQVAGLVQSIDCYRLASVIDEHMDDLVLAEDKARRAVTVAERAPAPPFTVADARSQLAGVLSERGECEEALTQQLSSVDLLDRFFDCTDELVRELAWLADCYRAVACYPEAFATLNRAERIIDEGDPAAWILYFFYFVRAGCYLDCLSFDNARQDGDTALSLARDCYGEFSRERITIRLLQLSVELASESLDSRDALLLARSEVAGILNETYGNAVRGAALVTAASIDFRLGDLTSAETQAREAITIFEGRSGSRSQMDARAAETLGRILTEAGRLDEAARMLEDAIAKRKSAAGGDRCPYTAKLLESLSRVVAARGAADQAAQLQKQAKEIREAVSAAAGMLE